MKLTTPTNLTQNDLPPEIAAELNESFEDLQAQLISVKEENELNEINALATPFDLLTYWIEKEGIKVGYQSYRKSTGKQITTKLLRSHFGNWCMGKNVKSKLFGGEGFEYAINLIQEEWLETENERISAMLWHKPEEENTQWNLLQRMSGFSDDDILILKAWMWKVKETVRTQMPVQRQVPMPMLFTTQGGTYKTTFVKHLTHDILKNLSTTASFKQLSDDFSNQKWSEMLVADFDEMSGMDKADMTKFKQWMTATELSWRGMRTESHNSVPRIVSPIGTSNKSLSEVLWDTTGSRRVWEIAMPSSLKETCEKLDFLELWREVPDVLPDLFDDKTYQRIMRIQQDEQRKKEPVEIWFEDFVQDTNEYQYGITKNPEPAKNQQEFLLKSLYEHYKGWCEYNKVSNAHTLSNNVFGKRISTFLDKHLTKKRTNKGTVYVLSGIIEVSGDTPLIKQQKLRAFLKQQER